MILVEIITKGCIFTLSSLFSYLVERFEGAGRFLVNFNLSVCLEAGGTCYLDVVILQDAYLPTVPCDWSNRQTSKDGQFR